LRYIFNFYVFPFYCRLRETVYDVEPSFVQELFLNGVARLYDPHSSFLSADTLEDFQMMMTNSLVGIGAVLQDDDGYCKILEIYGGSPAEQSGQLQVGDRILAVQQDGAEPVEIIGMRLNRAVKLIRGARGTAVTLHVQPAGGDPSDRKTVRLVRDEIQLTAQRARARLYEMAGCESGGPCLGYVKLPAFYGASDPTNGPDSYADVRELLLKLGDRSIRGLVLDLRGNSGGLLDEAIALAGLFLPPIPVVQVRDGEGQVQVFSDNATAITYDGPLVILTSKQSVSASEILAGALQDHGRAIVVGDHSTYGKGSVQAILPMNQSFLYIKNGPPLGAARITFQKWYLPNGDSIQRRGVPANISFPSFGDALLIGENNEDHALPWDSIAPAQWDRSAARTDFSHPITADLLRTLVKNSEDRHRLPEWELWEEQVNHFREKVHQKQFSLEIGVRQRQKAEDQLRRDQWKNRLRELARENFAFTDIRLDLVERNGAKQGNSPGDMGPEGGDDLPEFDVPLRESLRILMDWIVFQENGRKNSILDNDHGAPDDGNRIGDGSERRAVGANSGGN
jgi:carboxyl-terminal processing protease